LCGRDLPGQSVTGGFPLSGLRRAGPGDGRRLAAVGKARAITPATFLGHPVGCAMALGGSYPKIRRLKLVERSAALGKDLIRLLESKFQI